MSATLLDKWRFLGELAGDSRLSRGDYAVAWCLLEHCNAYGEAWPSKITLAAKTGQSVRNIPGCVERLESAGYFAVIRSRGRRSNRYRPQFNQPRTVKPDSPFRTLNSSTPLGRPTVNSASANGEVQFLSTVNSSSPESSYQPTQEPDRRLEESSVLEIGTRATPALRRDWLLVRTGTDG